MISPRPSDRTVLAIASVSAASTMPATRRAPAAGLVAARRGGDGRGHEPLPRSISTRADRPGTRRPGNGLPANRIFTGTR